MVAGGMEEREGIASALSATMTTEDFLYLSEYLSNCRTYSPMLEPSWSD